MFETPLTWLQRFTLPYDVVTCDEAAAAKGVTLDRELKSLVLMTSAGCVVAHILGDDHLSLRSVKQALAVDEAHLMDAGGLDSLKLEPGRVSPFVPQLWELPQVVDPRVLGPAWVTTNDGTLNGYIVFDPLLLLRAESIVTVRIAERDEDPCNL